MNDDPELDLLLKRGQDLRRRGDLEQAERLFSEGLEKNPAWTEGRVWRASLRLQQKRYGDAREDLDDAVKRLGEPGWHHLLRAEARLELGDFKGCLEDLQQAEAWGRQGALTLGLKGVALALSDRWEEAFPAIDQALEAEPGPKMLLRLWGHIASNSTDPLRLIADRALKSAEEHPEKFWLPLLGGSALLYADFPEEALKPLRRASRAMPRSFYAQLNYGAALMQAGPPEKAIAVLDKAVELDRSQPRAYALRGEAKFRLGRRQAAREDFQEALALDHAGILPTQWEDGEGFSRFMAETMPDNADAQMTRGAYLLVHRYRPWKALPFAEKAVRLAPEKARAWALLGECRFWMLRWFGARDAYEKAVRCDRDRKVRLQWADGAGFRLYVFLIGG